MDKDAIAAKINAWAESARTFADSVLSPQRERALLYYNGTMKDVPAPEGRSSIVTTEVRDTIRAQQPSLMRTFFGPERVVEFKPRRASQEAEAKLRSAYIDLVIREDNEGYLEFYRWFKDAALALGVVKWWWEPLTEPIVEDMFGQTAEQVALLTNDDDVGFEVIGSNVITMDTGEQIPVYDVRITKVEERGRARFAAIPPEDFLFDPDASHLDECAFVAHRSRPTKGELLAMGYREDEIDAAGSNSFSDPSLEQVARSPDGVTDPFGTVVEDRLEYLEAYVLLDPKGQGIPSRWKACLLGPEMLRFEPWPEVPFALLTPDPTPPKLYGPSPPPATR
jgi:hypothetical protein